MGPGIDGVGHIATTSPITTGGIVDPDKCRVKGSTSGFTNPEEIMRVLFDFHCADHWRGHFHAIGTIALSWCRIATFVDFDGRSIASRNRRGEFFMIELIGIDIRNFTVKNIG